LAYSIYRDEEERGPEEVKEKPKPVGIVAPVFVWIVIIALAAAITLVIIPFAMAHNRTLFDSYLTYYSGHILTMSAILVISFIIAIWIGFRVSHTSKKKSEVIYVGINKAIYSVVAYTIAMLVLYYLFQRFSSGMFVALGQTAFEEYIVLIPCVIVIVVVPILALILSVVRKDSVPLPNKKVPRL
jgi:magnesium-transporting ATPase (P-type)